MSCGSLLNRPRRGTVLAERWVKTNQYHRQSVYPRSEVPPRGDSRAPLHRAARQRYRPRQARAARIWVWCDSRVDPTEVEVKRPLSITVTHTPDGRRVDGEGIDAHATNGPLEVAGVPHIFHPGDNCIGKPSLIVSDWEGYVSIMRYSSCREVADAAPGHHTRH